MASRSVCVLHLIDGLGGGGSERWVVDIVRLSAPRGIRHRVVTVYPESGWFVHADELERLGAYGPATGTGARRGHEGAATRARPDPPRHASRGRAASLLWLGRRAVRVLPGAIYRSLREWAALRPDVIHGHMFYGFIFALVLGRLTRTPVVCTVPSLLSQMAWAPWLPRAYARFHAGIDRFFTAYPHELQGLGVPPAKITHMVGVIDLSRTEPAYAAREHHRTRVRSELGIPADAPVALSVGRLDPVKGHELGAVAVASAARDVPGLHWIVVGYGAWRTEVERRIDELGIAPMTRLVGFKADVLPYYAAADVYLRTVVMEGENLSSYQAMAMGLPVVGFDTGSPTELVREVGHGALVPDRDAEAFGSAVARILRSDDRGRALGRRGRDHALRWLDIERTIDAFARTYVGLARDQAGGA